MKNFILFIAILFSVAAHAQRFEEVVLWQVETRAKGLVFGISKSKSNAERIIEDFQDRNADSKYDISAFSPIFKYTTFPVKNRSESPINNFIAMVGKPYKVLSYDDLKSLEIIEEQNFEQGVLYYMNARDAEKKYVTNRLQKLVTNYEKYRIKNPKGHLVYSK